MSVILHRGWAAGGAAVCLVVVLADGRFAQAQLCQTIVDANGSVTQICQGPNRMTGPDAPISGGDPGAIFVPDPARIGAEAGATVPIQLLNGQILPEDLETSLPPGTIRVEGSGVGATGDRLTIEGFRSWSEQR